MTSRITAGSARVGELDAVRGLLALWVVVSHILSWCGFAHLQLRGRLGMIWHYVVGPDPAVETFFILSGFAITFLVYGRAQSYTSFMIGRWFRIYPVYLICLLATVLLSGVTQWLVAAVSWHDATYLQELAVLSQNEQSRPVMHLLGHLTLLNGMVPKGVLPWSAVSFLPPAWSITVEWQYYLVAPFVIRFACTAPGLLALTGVAWLGHRYAGPWQNPLLAFLPALLPFFLIGIASYHIYAHFRQSGGQRSERYLVGIVAALACAALVPWKSVTLAIWAIAFGCLFIDGTSLLARCFVGLRGVLNHPWLEWLGRLSYPLYLVHWPVIIVLLSLLVRIRPGITSIQAAVSLLLGGIPIILLAADVLHRTVEAPGMKLGKRLSRGGPSSKPSLLVQPVQAVRTNAPSDLIEPRS